MATENSTPNTALAIAAAAARYRARKAARIARKHNRQNAQHKRAIERRIQAADTVLAATGKVVAL